VGVKVSDGHNLPGFISVLEVMMSGALDMDVFTNALDYLNYGCEQLSEQEETNIKQSVLNIWSGIELTLKARLMVEHWTLIYKDTNRANEANFKNGDFESVDFKCCVERLDNICGVGINRNILEQLNSLRILRNKIMHFQINVEKDDVITYVCQAMSFVIDFIKDYLSDHLKPENIEEYGKLKDSALAIERYQDERYALTQQTIDRIIATSPGVLIVKCPNCGNSQRLVIRDHDDVECVFCNKSYNSQEAAADYYMEQFSGYRPKELHGVDTSPLTCPYCDMDTFVPLNDEDKSRLDEHAACFSCAEFQGEEIEECMECGRPFNAGPFDENGGRITICPECLEYKAGSD